MKLLEHKGMRCWVREGTTDEKVFDEVIKRHVYERKDFVIGSGETWLDLGGNIGTFAVYAGAKGATVHSFEPEPKNFALLEKNRAENKVQGIAVMGAAVGSSEKFMKLSLHEDTNNHYRHSLVKSKHGETITVQCFHISDLISDTIDGVKMDIEGSEFSVINALEDWKNVKKMVFEYSFDVQPNMFYFYKIIGKLKKHFSVVDYGKIPAGLKEYKFFPPARMIYCTK